MRQPKQPFHEGWFHKAQDLNYLHVAILTENWIDVQRQFQLAPSSKNFGRIMRYFATPQGAIHYQRRFLAWRDQSSQYRMLRATAICKLLQCDAHRFRLQKLGIV